MKEIREIVGYSDELIGKYYIENNGIYLSEVANGEKSLFIFDNENDAFTYLNIYKSKEDKSYNTVKIYNHNRLNNIFKRFTIIKYDHPDYSGKYILRDMLTKEYDYEVIFSSVEDAIIYKILVIGNPCRYTVVDIDESCIPISKLSNSKLQEPFTDDQLNDALNSLEATYYNISEDIENLKCDTNIDSDKDHIVKKRVIGKVSGYIIRNIISGDFMNTEDTYVKGPAVFRTEEDANRFLNNTMHIMNKYNFSIEYINDRYFRKGYILVSFDDNFK